VWLICTACAIIGCVYTLIALACVRRLKLDAQPAYEPEALLSVSILKPLYGAEPELFQNLLSFVNQEYAGPTEVLFGCQDQDDPALTAVHQIPRGQSRPALIVVANPTRHGENGKISNLINMTKAAGGEVIVLADSDMRVRPAYLCNILEALDRPGVGLVTCLYRGLPVTGLWSQLSAMAIDHHFLPSVLVGLRLRLAKPCFGSTIALRRDTLANIGGFEAFSDVLADDYAIGAAVRGLGYDVAIAPMVLEHACGEASFAELVAHELRWARTIRVVDPLGSAGSIVTHALPLAMLAFLLAPGPIGAGVLAAALACRLALQIQVDRVFGWGVARLWWGPVRDFLSFSIYVASFWPGAVSWRGRRHRIARDGTMS
jgi:ceramide glucosyltransferase